MKQEELNAGARRYIEAGEYTARKLWEAACKHDAIPPDSKFVVFSKTNPFASMLNQARIQVEEARIQYAAGGYVGLSMRRK
jgi:hypothetical protein